MPEEIVAGLVGFGVVAAAYLLGFWHGYRKSDY